VASSHAKVVASRAFALATTTVSPLRLRWLCRRQRVEYRVAGPARTSNFGAGATRLRSLWFRRFNLIVLRTPYWSLPSPPKARQTLGTLRGALRHGRLEQRRGRPVVFSS